MEGMASRRAVVTGASTGIGEATVRLLRQNGWDVVAVARRAERLEALAQESGAEAFAADITVQRDAQGQVRLQRRPADTADIDHHAKT